MRQLQGVLARYCFHLLYEFLYLQLPDSVRWPVREKDTTMLLILLLLGQVILSTLIGQIYKHISQSFLLIGLASFVIDLLTLSAYWSIFEVDSWYSIFVCLSSLVGFLSQLFPVKLYL